MDNKYKKLYYSLSATRKKPSPKKEISKEEGLSDYVVDHVLSFIPKSRTLDSLIDELNNGKVHRITRR